VTLGGGAVADEQELVARVRPAAGKAVGLAADEGKRIVAAVAEKPVGSPRPSMTSSPASPNRLSPIHNLHLLRHCYTKPQLRMLRVFARWTAGE
jgi:hypothetical protein